MTEFLLFLHILLFVFSFTFTAGTGIIGSRLVRGRDAKIIHAYFSAVRPLSAAGGIGWLLTAGAGFALARAYGYDLMETWLLCSYAAFAVLFLVGALVHSPWQAKVLAASANPGPELEALLNAPIHRITSAVSGISVLTLVYLMTARPAL
ncbi:MAG TPA: DUF2269 family protein [Rhizomicrobium sp.]|nr:DUF2269 family protein [Rhizomicrobium sp.]